MEAISRGGGGGGERAVLPVEGVLLPREKGYFCCAGRGTFATLDGVPFVR